MFQAGAHLRSAYTGETCRVVSTYPTLAVRWLGGELQVLTVIDLGLHKFEIVGKAGA